MNETTKEPIGRPALTFRHPNAKNTGSAIQFRVHPATYASDGAVLLTIARQMTIGNPAAEDPAERDATFDWAEAATVKLSPIEAAEILMVFGGHAPSLVHAGKDGIYHNSADATTSVLLKRSEDPECPGFLLGVGRVPKANPNARHHYSFTFWPAEAFLLRNALLAKMGELVFGVNGFEITFNTKTEGEAL